MDPVGEQFVCLEARSRARPLRTCPGDGEPRRSAPRPPRRRFGRGLKGKVGCELNVRLRGSLARPWRGAMGTRHGELQLGASLGQERTLHRSLPVFGAVPVCGWVNSQYLSDYIMIMFIYHYNTFYCHILVDYNSYYSYILSKQEDQ